MEPKFQTSFIPKKTIVTDNSPVPGLGVVRETNIISVVATVLFVASFLTSIGIFGYKFLLERQINQAKQDIATASEAFQVDKIKELIDASNRISGSKILLEKHVNLSKLLYLFQSLTVKHLRIVRMTYKNDNNIPLVTLNAETLNYNALAEQNRIFSESEYLKNAKFSNLSLRDNGNVIADFTATIDTSLISYKKAVESMSSSDTTDQNQ